MTVLTNTQMKELFEQAGIGIANSKDNPLLLDSVRDFGYTQESLLEAEALYKEAENLYLTQGPKKGRKINLSIQLRDKIDEIHRVYMTYVRVLRRDLYDDPGLLKELLLVEAWDFTFSGKLKESKEFYKNCMDNHGGKLGEVVLKYGLSLERLQTHLDSITDVELDRNFRASMVMDSEKTTEDRNKVIYRLYTWWRNYRDVLVYVFRKDPQQLEAFKITGYSMGYKPASKSANGGEAPETPEPSEPPTGETPGTQLQENVQ